LTPFIKSRRPGAQHLHTTVLPGHNVSSILPTMAVPNYGAAPLSKTFLILRAFQLVCFIGIVGMTANFVAEIVSSGATAPSEIVGTLIIVCAFLSVGRLLLTKSCRLPLPPSTAYLVWPSFGLQPISACWSCADSTFCYSSHLPLSRSYLASHSHILTASSSAMRPPLWMLLPRFRSLSLWAAT